jgi:hypothetical protein
MPYVRSQGLRIHYQSRWEDTWSTARWYSRIDTRSSRTRVCSRLPEAYAPLRLPAAADTWRYAS